MTVSLPWLVAAAFVIVFVFAWNALDHRWLIGRIDDIDEAADRNLDAHNKRLAEHDDRLERIEDWVKFFERVRGQAGEPVEPVRFVVTGNTATGNTVADISDPGEVPTDVPGPSTQPIPATQPDNIAIQVQSALIERPKSADWVEAEIEAMRARNAQRMARAESQGG